MIDYLKDFSNAEEWDPGTQTCARESSGPIEVGATWHNVSKIVGVTAELTYTLNQLSNRTLVFVGKNDSSTSVDTITVDASGAGSVITYKADLEMKGARQRHREAAVFGPQRAVVTDPEAPGGRWHRRRRR